MQLDQDAWVVAMQDAHGIGFGAVPKCVRRVYPQLFLEFARDRLNECLAAFTFPARELPPPL